MRPKKRILLIDFNENRQSAVRFMLQTNGFHVISAAAPLKGSLDHHPELILGIWPVQPAYFTELAKAAGLPSIVVVSETDDHPSNFMADTVLLNPTPAELLERIKVMSARKRGPKRAFPLNQQPAPAQASA